MTGFSGLATALFIETNIPVAIKHKYDISLKPLHTFGMDVKAAEYISYGSEEELAEVLDGLHCIRNAGRQILHIGSGSNLLFTRDFDGVILHSDIKFIEELIPDPDHGSDSVSFRVGAGVVWDDLCEYFAERGIYGTENLSYIPGEVGAAAVQNIGAYGMEVCRLIDSVEAVETATGKKRVFTCEECDYGYRDSIFKNELRGKYIIVAVRFVLSAKPVFHLEYGALKKLKESESTDAAEIRREIIKIRQSKLPDVGKMGSAGSFFKNPVISTEHFERLLAEYSEIPHFFVNRGKMVKIPAAWLIDTCGWKGCRYGGATVYEKQPLVIINMGNAVPGDVVSLAADIRLSVKEKFGIEIYPEVNYIG